MTRAGLTTAGLTAAASLSRSAAPDPPRRYVDRPRLTGQLDGRDGPGVTLVCAPAGWGKTVLLSAWAASAPEMCAWLGLERADPARFWDQVAGALRLTGAVAASTFCDQSGPAVVERLIDWSHQPGDPVTVVVDDFHELTDPGVLAEVAFLVQHAGRRLHLVLATRVDPALPLHRWRLSGIVREIRRPQLAFTMDEAETLLAEHGIRLSQPALTRLQAACTGWAACLRLAALSMQTSAEPERVAAGFAAPDPVLSDYLLREVVDPLPGDARDVLLRTSVLDEVTEDLVAALTGRRDGARILAGLERATGLLTRVSGPGDRYRCHPLLGQVLRGELRRQLGGEVTELHRRAARWYARHDPPGGALRHALAAGEWAQAVEVLAGTWPDLVSGARRPTTAGPVAAPPELLRADSRLALALAADRLDAKDPAGATAFVRLADRVLADGGAGRGADPMTLAFRLAAAQLSGDLDRVLATAPHLLAETADMRLGLHEQTRAHALVALGGARLYRGEVDAAEPLLRNGLAAAEVAGADRVRLAAMNQVAVLEILLGRLTAAERMARRALEFGATRGADAGDVVWARLALAEVAYERDLLDQAAYQLQRALDGVGQADPWVLAGTSLLRARLHGSMGRPAEACAVISRARADLADVAMPPLLDRSLILVEADLRAAAADTGRARRLLAGIQQHRVTAPWVAVSGARIDLSEGRSAAAAAATAGYGTGFTDPGTSAMLALDGALAHARATHGLGDRKRSAAALENALRIADEEGYRRPFRAGGPEVGGLLAAHLGRATAHRSVALDLLEGLRDSGSGEHRAGTPPARRHPMAEPLTDRELAVLRYLQSMLSNVEIGDMMCVSVNTVKTHVKNIYRKLDTGRRRDAVRRAHELGLL
jgi:LuxR family maltose regulon positive regulatory protein